MSSLRILSVVCGLSAFACAWEAAATPLIYAPRNPDFFPMTNSQNAISATNQANYLKATTDTPPHVPSSEDNLLTGNIMSNLSDHYTSVLTAASPKSGTLDFGDGSSATYYTVNGIRNITFFFLDGTSTGVSIPLN